MKLQNLQDLIGSLPTELPITCGITNEPVDQREIVTRFNSIDAMEPSYVFEPVCRKHVDFDGLRVALWENKADNGNCQVVLTEITPLEKEGDVVTLYNGFINGSTSEGTRPPMITSRGVDHSNVRALLAVFMHGTHHSTYDNPETQLAFYTAARHFQAAECEANLVGTAVGEVHCVGHITIDDTNGKLITIQHFKDDEGNSAIVGALCSGTKFDANQCNEIEACCQLIPNKEIPNEAGVAHSPNVIHAKENLLFYNGVFGEQFYILELGFSYYKVLVGILNLLTNTEANPVKK